MPREFVNPNLHVILIHYPLGLLSLGTMIELLAVFFWRRSVFRLVGRWMIFIGALAMVPAATVGLYAMQDVNRTAETEEGSGATWADVREASPIKGEAWEMMTRHAWLNAAGSVVLLLIVVLWLASSDAWRDRLHVVFLLVLLGGLGVILLGAWYGGEMVYLHRVGVEEKPAEVAEAADASEPAHDEAADWKKRAAFYVPPLQLHVILAGSAISLAMAALGLSLRGRGAGGVTASRYDDGIAAALAPQPRPPYPGQQQFQSSEPEAPPPPRAPVARFWLLAALLAIAAALTGWWTLAHFSDVWSVNELWAQVLNKDNPDDRRRLAHLLTGVAIVALMLVLAILSRVAIGRRIVVSIFALALLAAVVAQIWFGSLLMFDSTSGPLGNFNGAAASFAPESKPESEPATEPSTEPATRPATTSVTTTN